MEAALDQPQGIRAYHGSPHDFDKFDISKIGTGEGAQAYGHGLYFADNEEVAKFYRDSISDGWDPVFGGQRWDHMNPQHRAANEVSLANGDRGKAIVAAEEQLAAIKSVGRRANRDQIKLWQETLDILKSDQPLLEKSRGHMYEVNIRAHPDDFLDWDKPFSQQSEKVRQALSRLPPDVTSGDPSGAALYGQKLPFELMFENGIKGLPGEQLSTLALKELGIPGIRYLDAMSRGAGNGTANYTVFDDSLIDILRKYANAPTGAALPLAAEGQDIDPTDPVILDVLRQYGMLN